MLHLYQRPVIQDAPMTTEQEVYVPHCGSTLFDAANPGRSHLTNGLIEEIPPSPGEHSL